MLITTLILTWAATHQRAPFATLSPAESVVSLQIYLSVSIVPLMCLAALIEERRRAGRALAERLSFEAFVARLSGSFVHLPSDRMDRAFETWLGRIGTFLSVDRVLLLRLAGDGRALEVVHSWGAAGLGPMPRIDVGAELPWTVSLLLREQPMILARLGDAPSEAARDLESLRRHEVRSKLVLPLVAGGRVFGGLAFVTVHAEREWPEELVGGMTLVAEVFASALGRKESEDALRESELMKSAILSSLSSGVAVLGRDGGIVAVNEAWRGADPAAARLEPRVGGNYLDVWREPASHGEPRAIDALAGVQAVLTGARTGFTFECPSVTPGRERWFAIAVVALSHPEGGAVVSHTDITERKRAEIEAQKSRQELAHVTRVSAMGELTASLAHELNQPLTGILANAQAARRFLDASPPNLDEVRDILADIVEDDKRAAEVIRRLRALLRKGDAEMAELDVEILVKDVVKLLGSDTVIRDVTVRLDLGAPSATVVGDRVQLQQVILNLLMNGMEAMADCARGERQLVVRTRALGVDRLEIAVEDAGPGVRAGTHELMFEPFYSTKPNGMGMGLAIARSIIESHGGTIWAANNGIRGATFRFTLPRVEAG
jgi:signal transduction histidine kinase